MASDLTDLGRFTEASIAIVIALRDGPKHGYAIMADVAAAAGQSLGPGTPPLEDRRRPYRLPGLGATALRAHLGQLDRFIRAGLVRLNGSPRVG